MSILAGHNAEADGKCLFCRAGRLERTGGKVADPQTGELANSTFFVGVDEGAGFFCGEKVEGTRIETKKPGSSRYRKGTAGDGKGMPRCGESIGEIASLKSVTLGNDPFATHPTCTVPVRQKIPTTATRTSRREK